MVKKLFAAHRWLACFRFDRKSLKKSMENKMEEEDRYI